MDIRSDHLGAGGGEGLRETAPQSSGRAGYDDPLARQSDCAHDLTSMCNRSSIQASASPVAIRASAIVLPASVSMDGSTKLSSIATVSLAGMSYQPPII